MHFGGYGKNPGMISALQGVKHWMTCTYKSMSLILSDHLFMEFTMQNCEKRIKVSIATTRPKNNTDTLKAK